MNKTLATVLLVTGMALSAPKVDQDMVNHAEEVDNNAMMAAGYLAAGMVMVPVEDWACKKMGTGPIMTGTVKVVSGLVFGSLSLYNAGLAANNVRWVGIKFSRGF